MMSRYLNIKPTKRWVYFDKKIKKTVDSIKTQCLAILIFSYENMGFSDEKLCFKQKKLSINNDF